jgi:hypothetical protein
MRPGATFEALCVSTAPLAAKLAQHATAGTTRPSPPAIRPSIPPLGDRLLSPESHRRPRNASRATRAERRLISRQRYPYTQYKACGRTPCRPRSRDTGVQPLPPGITDKGAASGDALAWPRAAPCSARRGATSRRELLGEHCGVDHEGGLLEEIVLVPNWPRRPRRRSGPGQVVLRHGHAGGAGTHPVEVR